MALRVAAIGEIVEDLYLPDEAGFLGGIATNVARAAARAGAEVSLYGAVGHDARGERLRRRLGEAGLAELHVRTLPGATATQRIRLEPDGERVFCGFEVGVSADYRLADGERAALCGAGGPDVLALVASPELGALFADCLTLPVRPGQRLVADFSQDSPMGAADAPERWVGPFVDRLAVAFVGGREELVERLAPLTVGRATVIVVTAGARGAFACAAGRVAHQPSVATAVVDTTGCGDAFQGAFTVAWASGAGLAVALRAGAESAALAAARRGA